MSSIVLNNTPKIQSAQPVSPLEGVNLEIDRLMGLINTMGREVARTQEQFSEALLPSPPEAVEDCFGSLSAPCSSLESRLQALHRELSRHLHDLSCINNRCRLG